MRGLGMLPGRVRALRARASRLRKVPHMGWNAAAHRAAARRHLAGIDDGALRLLRALLLRRAARIRRSSRRRRDYGGEFAAAVARDNLFACQFHPEKSQAVGPRASSRNFVRRRATPARRVAARWRSIVIPAIDLRGGRCVRLRAGRLRRETRLRRRSGRRWRGAGEAAGARVAARRRPRRRARAARRCNGAAIARDLRARCAIPVEVGGGIRDLERARSAARRRRRPRRSSAPPRLREPELRRRRLPRASRPRRGRHRRARRQGRGRRAGSETARPTRDRARAPARERAGAAAIVYTDIARDGTRRGRQRRGDARARARARRVPVIASGGVALARRRRAALRGVRRGADVARRDRRPRALRPARSTCATRSRVGRGEGALMLRASASSPAST